MKYFVSFFLICYGLTGFSQKSFKYPDAPKEDIADTLWGQIIPDPYRWLENLNSDQTHTWLAAQKELQEQETGRNFRGLSTFLPVYSSIKNSPMFKDGKYCFVYKIDRIYKSHSLHYATHPSHDFRLLFDPNRNLGNRNYNIDEIAVSCDDRTIALVLSKNTGDWKTIRFLDIESGKLLDDSLVFVKYSNL